MFQRWLVILQFLELLILSTCDSFGDNIIINSKFSLPILPYGSAGRSYSNIPGWSCQKGCQINNCYLLNQFSVQTGLKFFADCDNQILDISRLSYGFITQQFQALAGQYLLESQFLLPLSNSNQKTLLLFVNGIEIFRYRPIVQRDFNRYYLNVSVKAKQGINNISFNMQGLDDSRGFRLYSVSLRRIIDDQFDQILDDCLNSSVLQSVVKIPAARIVFGQLVNLLVSFDRLQLYFYHNRDYSYNTKKFLQKVSSLLSQKGAFSQQVIDKLFEKVIHYTQYFIQTLNYKSAYLGVMIKNQPQTGMGFIQNNVNIIFYSLPLYITLIIVFYLFFRLTAQLKISKVFRKYCLTAIILVMIFNGNIEQFSFYLFGQIYSLFSFSFYHKLLNIIIIFFLFILIFVASALYLLLKINYGKLSHCLFEGISLKYIGIILYSLDNGVFCFILGAVHQCLIKTPEKQLLVLSIVQICWIISQINGLYHRIYKSPVFVYLSVCQGLLRIVFVAFLHVYEMCKQNAVLANFINSTIQRTIIILFLALWSLLLFISIIQWMISIKDLLASSQNLKSTEVKVSKRDQKVNEQIFKFKDISPKKIQDVLDKKKIDQRQ